MEKKEKHKLDPAVDVRDVLLKEIQEAPKGKSEAEGAKSKPEIEQHEHERGKFEGETLIHSTSIRHRPEKIKRLGCGKIFRKGKRKSRKVRRKGLKFSRASVIIESDIRRTT